MVDVETSGLPPRHSEYKKYHDPKQFEMYNSCRVIELAYSSSVMCQGTHFDIKKYSSVVRPENFVIENDFIHNISNTNATTYGESIEKVLDTFMDEVKKVDMIVAHNIQFDALTILSELHRLGRDEDATIFNNKIWYCTMLHGMEYLKMKRWPKLIALYQSIFPQHANMVQSHRAMDDVMLCKDCFSNMYG